ncbi:MAG: methyltransferase [Deltaproteobacteria bacterium]|nr:methyltransferase [Deltaproteobacteria bacterium]
MSYSSPEEVLRLARNFMESRILLSGAELNVFTILSHAPLTAKEVSDRTGTDMRALTILLDALAAMGFLIKHNDAYRCTPSLTPLLAEDQPGSVLPMILHAAHLWRRWSSLTNVAAGTKESEGTSSPSRSAEEMRAFIGAMHVVAEPQAREIITAVNPGSAKALLDVGGASGTYTIAFLHAVPEMRATLFDMPEVVEMARERLGRAGMLDRVTLVPGDFYRDEFPRGHDLAFVSAIIHQNSLDQNVNLYHKIFRSLNRGGRIVIRDHIMDNNRIYPRDGAIFAVNMLLGTSGGGTYTYEEIKTGLSQAGFAGMRLIRKGDHMDALMEAFKP